MRLAWNYSSGVASCPECDGQGVVPAHRPRTVNDPYPEDRCEACDGEERAPECPVCGFDQVVIGYDCLACDTAASMYASDLAAFDADKFAAALKVAVGLALADERKAA